MRIKYEPIWQQDLDSKGFLRVKKDILCQNGIIKKGEIIISCIVVSCNKSRTTCVLRMQTYYCNPSCFFEAEFEGFCFEDWFEPEKELNQLLADISIEDDWFNIQFFFLWLLFFSLASIIFFDGLFIKLGGIVTFGASIYFLWKSKKHLSNLERMHKHVLQLTNGEKKV